MKDLFNPLETPQPYCLYFQTQMGSSDDVESIQKRFEEPEEMTSEP